MSLLATDLTLEGVVSGLKSANSGNRIDVEEGRVLMVETCGRRRKLIGSAFLYGIGVWGKKGL